MQHLPAIARAALVRREEGVLDLGVADLAERAPSLAIHGEIQKRVLPQFGRPVGGRRDGPVPVDVELTDVADTCGRRHRDDPGAADDLLELAQAAEQHVDAGSECVVARDVRFQAAQIGNGSMKVQQPDGEPLQIGSVDSIGQGAGEAEVHVQEEQRARGGVESNVSIVQPEQHRSVRIDDLEEGWRRGWAQGGAEQRKRAVRQLQLEPATEPEASILQSAVLSRPRDEAQGRSALDREPVGSPLFRLSRRLDRTDANAQIGQQPLIQLQRDGPSVQAPDLIGGAGGSNPWAGGKDHQDRDSKEARRPEEAQAGPPGSLGVVRGRQLSIHRRSRPREAAGAFLERRQPWTSSPGSRGCAWIALPQPSVQR